MKTAVTGNSGSTSGAARRAVHFWFRAEQKRGEHRPLLHPPHVKQLLAAGHAVTVEKSRQRVILDEEYQRIDGVVMAPEFSWRKAPLDAVVVGLKELDIDEQDYPIAHKHIYFAHCYKGQKGGEKLLKRFKTGGGSLYDIEFLVDDRGVRVASFSNAAGKVGAAMGVRLWAQQRLGSSEKVPPLADTYPSYASLMDHIRPTLEKAKARAGRTPSVLVIGALGKSGRGAVDVASGLGVNVVKWDMAETSKGGPFKEILDHDILVNCIYLNPKAPKSAPFLSIPLIEQYQNERKLSVIADVSCDTTNPNNPIPVYNSSTSFENPSLTIFDKPFPLEVIAIDHLPSLVPQESSKDFTDQLINHLVQFDQTPVWQRALTLFKEKIASV